LVDSLDKELQAQKDAAFDKQRVVLILKDTISELKKEKRESMLYDLELLLTLI
jgi:hypothetical protein